MAKLKLSVIGCGNVAKTLANLWHQSGVVEIVDVVNTSLKGAEDSVAFIGAGNPLVNTDSLQAADVFLIGCGDDNIVECVQQLEAVGVVKPGNIVFHCSGSKPSSIISAQKWGGVFTASLHPVKSFADPEIAITNFSSTYCGFEGDQRALQILKPWVEAIGGIAFDIDADNKLIYHAASVIACNYLTALQELSIQAFAQSGVERDLAMKILEPIVKGSVDNIFELGTAKALTGPIARGDHMVVAEQLKAVENWDANAAEVYKQLGLICTVLSKEQGSSSNPNLDKIKKTLTKS